VSPEPPLYQRDPVAWQAHLAEGNARQARKRVSADVILRDHTGRVLLVEPRYKPDWDTPGGMTEANEPPHEAARRELQEELNLEIVAFKLVCVDWVSPHGPWDDLLAFVFDGGTLSESQISSIAVHDEELSSFEFCTVDQAAQRLRPYVWRRLEAALTAMSSGQVAYLQDGNRLG
jgi:8-oxo-dGTP diphosphatase